jgi:hypothetical protein
VPDPAPEPDPAPADESPPLTGDALKFVTCLRQLRAVKAERDSWRAEALALRARLGLTQPDRWRRPAPGLRRVWLEDNDNSEWM